MGFNMTEEERRRRVRTELAAQLAKSLTYALDTDLGSEAALIATLINAIVTNKATDLLLTIQQKPAA